MLIRAQGRCEACSESFGQLDMIQSVDVECADCGRRHTLCRGCQAKGCPSCGARVLDAWERAERDPPGQGVMF